MPRTPIPTWYFALVIARLDERFLLVEERNGQWYLPAGRVEPGEGIPHAAIRETQEEAGVRVALEGIYRIEHTPAAESARVRVFFVARPEGDATPKSVADDESRSARWVTIEEARKLRLRSPEVLLHLERVAGGCPLAPLAILASESEES